MVSGDKRREEKSTIWREGTAMRCGAVQFIDCTVLMC